MSLDTKDPTFVSDLLASNESVLAVANFFQRKGKPVTVQGIRVRDTVDNRSEYADDGDLHVHERYEVKRRTIEFSSLADFPFQTVIVDVCHSWDKAFPKPRGYFILSKSMSCALFVPGDTSKSWVKTAKYDAHANRTRDFYECPVGLTFFVRLNA